MATQLTPFFGGQQAPFQPQQQPQQQQGADPRLLLGLAQGAQGFLQGGQRGGLGAALLGLGSGALGGVAQGQFLQQKQAQQQQAAQAAAQQQALENQRAQQKAALDAAKFETQKRQFGVTSGLKQEAAQEGIRQFEATEGRLGRAAGVAEELGRSNLAARQAELAGRTEPLTPVFDPVTGETRFQTRSDAIGQMAPPKSGFEVVTDPTTGQTTVRTGVTGGTGLGKKAQGQIESQSVDLTAARERLNNIAAAWRPEFSQLQTQLGMKVKEARDRVGLLGPEQQAGLADFTRFQQNTIKNLNSTIKEITGAAMNQQEVPRIQREVPVESDSPAVFEAKLRNALKLTGLAQARLAHLRTQGLSAGPDFGGIELDDMPSIMDQRGAEIEAQMVQQGFDPAVAEQQAMAQVRQEFGF